MDRYLYPWQHDLWTNIVRRHRKSGLPHALLVSGAAGIGKHNLSLNIARWLLRLRAMPQLPALGSGKPPRLYVMPARRK